GHVHSGLPYAYDAVNSVFTDCKAIGTLLMEEYGYNTDKFITHYQPVTTSLEAPRAGSNIKLRVLWASRIAKQKRPDILAAIGKDLAGSEIEIDVYGSFQDGYNKSLFDNIENITYIRQFNGIDDLPTKDY